MTRGFAYLFAYTFETLLIKAPLITLHRCNLLRIIYYDPPLTIPSFLWRLYRIARLDYNIGETDR